MAASSSSTIIGRDQAAGAPLTSTALSSISTNIKRDHAVGVPSISTTISSDDVDGLDNKLRQDIEKNLKIFEPLLKPTSARREAVGVLASLIGSSLEQSGSSTLTEDSAGTSNAITQASQHLDTILQLTDLSGTQQYGFAVYQSKVEKLPSHILRIQDSDGATEFQRSPEEWRLIWLAATASKEVYEDLDKVVAASKLEPKKLSNLKSTTIFIDESHGRRVLVVSIRGSATIRDWMVNANGAPRQSTKILDGSFSWHRGLLVVAEAMQDTIATEISKMPDVGIVDELLFTGHSAGGAIAQIFYAMSMTPDTKLWTTALGFNRVYCITFGCPPVATGRIRQSQLARFQSGLFLNIINEGDPVPLSQESYVRSLLELYALSEDDLEERYPKGFCVPEPAFRMSGCCVVLQDVEPDNVAATGWQALTAQADVVEKKLFGNPLVHNMGHYLERVEELGVQVGGIQVETS